MERYCGNTKPYIYASFPPEYEEKSRNILERLSTDEVSFWFADKFNRKEEKRLQGAFGILLFTSDDFSKSEKYHRIVDCAVENNKNILCVYLDDVKSTPWSDMQLGSQLALFSRNYPDEDSLVEKIKEAQIFQQMSVTDAQKKFQKNRGIATVTIPIAAAAILFFAVINPLLIEPTQSEASVIEQFGLSKADLKRIGQIHIVGNQSFDTEVHADYDHANNTKDYVIYDKANDNGNMEHQSAIPVGSLTSDDLEILKEMPSLVILELEGQQITDLNVLPKTDRVTHVRLNCNPISSLDGIENFKNLTFISVSDTYITDITPLLSLKDLCHIQLNYCPVSDLSGIEKLPRLQNLFISNTQVHTIPKLGELYSFTLDVGNQNIYDWSFISDVRSFGSLRICSNGVYNTPQIVMPYLKGKMIQELEWSGISSLNDLDGLNVSMCETINLSDNNLTTLNGIEKFDGIYCLNLYQHNGEYSKITDLTPILKLTTLKQLILSPNMQEMAETQLKDADFRIDYTY